jgi:hypothetical protein
MQEKKKRSNLETILGVKAIPTAPRIKTLPDGVEPDQFGKVFNETLKRAEERGVLEKYRMLEEGVLLAPDGVWYHSPENIHCKRCLRKKKTG